MVRIERDGDGNWTMDGEPMNLGDGTIPFDPPPGPFSTMTVNVFDENGRLKWSESTENPIEIAGVNAVLHTTFARPPWYKRFLKRFFNET